MFFASLGVKAGNVTVKNGDSTRDFTTLHDALNYINQYSSGRTVDVYVNTAHTSTSSYSTVDNGNRITIYGKKNVKVTTDKHIHISNGTLIVKDLEVDYRGTHSGFFDMESNKPGKLYIYSGDFMSIFSDFIHSDSKTGRIYIYGGTFDVGYPQFSCVWMRYAGTLYAYGGTFKNTGLSVSSSEQSSTGNYLPDGYAYYEVNGGISNSAIKEGCTYAVEVKPCPNVAGNCTYNNHKHTNKVYLKGSTVDATYCSIDYAISLINKTGGNFTLRLATDITDRIPTLEINNPNANVTLDLDGYKLRKAADGLDKIIKVTKGTLTIVDYGDLVDPSGYLESIEVGPEGHVTIKSGTFGFDPTDYCPINSYCIKSGDKWSVTYGYDAQCGNIKYKTLQEALNAAKDGETIKLLVNIAGSNITLNSGSKKIKIDSDGSRKMIYNYVNFSFGGSNTIEINNVEIRGNINLSDNATLIMNHPGAELNYVYLNSTGSSFQGRDGLCRQLRNTGNGIMDITGGTYFEDVNKYLKDNYVATYDPSDDKLYHITNKTPYGESIAVSLTQSNGAITGHANLGDAIDAAGEEQSPVFNVLTSFVEGYKNITIPKNVNAVIKSKQADKIQNISFNKRIDVEGSLSIENIKAQNAENASGFIMLDGGSVNLNNCRINRFNNNEVHVRKGNVTLRGSQTWVPNVIMEDGTSLTVQDGYVGHLTHRGQCNISFEGGEWGFDPANHCSGESHMGKGLVSIKKADSDLYTVGGADDACFQVVETGTKFGTFEAAINSLPINTATIKILKPYETLSTATTIPAEYDITLTGGSAQNVLTLNSNLIVEGHLKVADFHIANKEGFYVQVRENASLNIDNSNADVQKVVSDGGEIYLNNGTLTALTASNAEVEINGGAMGGLTTSGNTNVDINGNCSKCVIGEVTGTGNKINIANGNDITLPTTTPSQDLKGQFTITGGTFTNDPSNYLDDTTYYTQQDGKWVVGTGYTAKVDNVKYKTFELAVEAINEGSSATIELITDYTLKDPATIASGKNVVVKSFGDGKRKLTVNDKLSVSGNITIQNIDIFSEYPTQFLTINEGGGLTVNDEKVKISNLSATANSTSITISNGEIENHIIVPGQQSAINITGGIFGKDVNNLLTGNYVADHNAKEDPRYFVANSKDNKPYTVSLTMPSGLRQGYCTFDEAIQRVAGSGEKEPSFKLLADCKQGTGDIYIPTSVTNAIIDGGNYSLELTSPIQVMGSLTVNNGKVKVQTPGFDAPNVFVVNSTKGSLTINGTEIEPTSINGVNLQEGLFTLNSGKCPKVKVTGNTSKFVMNNGEVGTLDIPQDKPMVEIYGGKLTTLNHGDNIGGGTDFIKIEGGTFGFDPKYEQENVNGNHNHTTHGAKKQADGTYVVSGVDNDNFEVDIEGTKTSFGTFVSAISYAQAATTAGKSATVTVMAKNLHTNGATTINAGNSITLDAGGQTLTLDHIVKVTGTLIVKNGTFDIADENYYISAEDGGSLTISESGTTVAKVNVSNATLKMLNGSCNNLTATGNLTNCYIVGGTVAELNASNEAKVFVAEESQANTSGTVTLLKAADAAEITVNGGTVDGLEAMGSEGKVAKVNISGEKSTVNRLMPRKFSMADISNCKKLVFYKEQSANDHGKVAISGGAGIELATADPSSELKSLFTITGGTFVNVDPNRYLTYEYAGAETSSGSHIWKISGGQKVETDDGWKFKTLSDAISHVNGSNDAKIIILNEDIKETGITRLSNSKNIIIRGGGHSLERHSLETNDLSIACNVTLENIKLVGSSNRLHVLNNGTLNIASSDVEVNNILAERDATVNISNGVIHDYIFMGNNITIEGGTFDKDVNDLLKGRYVANHDAQSSTPEGKKYVVTNGGDNQYTVTLTIGDGYRQGFTTLADAIKTEVSGTEDTERKYKLLADCEQGTDQISIAEGSKATIDGDFKLNLSKPIVVAGTLTFNGMEVTLAESYTGTEVFSVNNANATLNINGATIPGKVKETDTNEITSVNVSAGKLVLNSGICPVIQATAGAVKINGGNINLLTIPSGTPKVDIYGGFLEKLSHGEQLLNTGTQHITIEGGTFGFDPQATVETLESTHTHATHSSTPVDENHWIVQGSENDKFEVNIGSNNTRFNNFASAMSFAQTQSANEAKITVKAAGCETNDYTTILKGKTIVIDAGGNGNGLKLNHAINVAGNLVLQNGEFSMKDDGCKIGVGEGGQLTLTGETDVKVYNVVVAKSGTMQINGSKAIATSVEVNGGTLNMLDGTCTTLTASGQNTSCRLVGGTVETINASENAKFFVAEYATSTATTKGYVKTLNSNGADVTITSGTVDALYAHTNSKTTINGCEKVDIKPLTNTEETMGTVIIDGGNDITLPTEDPDQVKVKAMFTITGGTFINNPTKYLDNTVYAVKGTDNKWTVSSGYVAKIGDVKYSTFEDAVAAVNAAASTEQPTVIEMLVSYTLTDNITLASGKNVVVKSVDSNTKLDLTVNGKLNVLGSLTPQNINIKSANSTYLTVANGGTLTVEDATVEIDAIAINNAIVNISNGIIHNHVINTDANNINITGGTFDKDIDLCLKGNYVADHSADTNWKYVVSNGNGDYKVALWLDNGFRHGYNSLADAMTNVSGNTAPKLKLLADCSQGDSQIRIPTTIKATIYGNEHKMTLSSPILVAGEFSINGGEVVLANGFGDTPIINVNDINIQESGITYNADNALLTINGTKFPQGKESISISKGSLVVNSCTNGKIQAAGGNVTIFSGEIEALNIPASAADGAPVVDVHNGHIAEMNVLSSKPNITIHDGSLDKLVHTDAIHAGTDFINIEGGVFGFNPSYATDSNEQHHNHSTHGAEERDGKWYVSGNNNDNFQVVTGTNTSYFSTLESAISNASQYAGEAKVTVWHDNQTTLSNITVQKGSNLILDVNGKNFRLAHAINIAGNVKVQNGTLVIPESNNSGMLNVAEGGTLTITGDQVITVPKVTVATNGTLEMASDHATATDISVTGGTLRMLAGKCTTLTASGQTAICYVVGGSVTNLNASTEANIFVASNPQNGAAQGSVTKLSATSKASVNISKATVAELTASSDAANNMPTVNIAEGGIVNKLIARTNSVTNITGVNSQVVIEPQADNAYGTINISNGSAIKLPSAEKVASVSITGGTFVDVNPNPYLTDTYYGEQGPDNTWTVTNEYVAQVGDVKFKTLKGAFDHVNTLSGTSQSTTVKIVDNIQITDYEAALSSGVKATVNGNGHTITIGRDNGMTISGEAWLQNIKIATANNSINVAAGGKLHIDNANVEVDNISVAANGQAYISNGILHNYRCANQGQIFITGGAFNSDVTADLTGHYVAEYTPVSADPETDKLYHVRNTNAGETAEFKLYLKKSDGTIKGYTSLAAAIGNAGNRASFILLDDCQEDQQLSIPSTLTDASISVKSGNGYKLTVANPVIVSGKAVMNNILIVKNAVSFTGSELVNINGGTLIIDGNTSLPNNNALAIDNDPVSVKIASGKLTVKNGICPSIQMESNTALSVEGGKVASLQHGDNCIIEFSGGQWHFNPELHCHGNSHMKSGVFVSAPDNNGWYTTTTEGIFNLAYGNTVTLHNSFEGAVTSIPFDIHEATISINGNYTTTETVTIPMGYTLNVTSESGKILTLGSNLIINGGLKMESGIIASTSANEAVNISSGTLVMNGGTIDNVVANGNAECSILGGAVTHLNGQAGTILNVSAGTVSSLAATGSTIGISGGVVTALEATESTVDITNGTIRSAKALNGTHINISGCEACTVAAPEGTGAVVITNGSHITLPDVAKVPGITITGGRFVTDPNAYLDEKYFAPTPSSATDNLYVVTAEYVAKIVNAQGETVEKKKSFREAVEAANGQRIVLVDNCSVCADNESEWSTDKAVAFDGGTEYTLNVNKDVTFNGTLTILSGKIAGDGRMIIGGTATVKGGECNSIQLASNSTLNIDGGVISTLSINGTNCTVNGNAGTCTVFAVGNSASATIGGSGSGTRFEGAILYAGASATVNNGSFGRLGALAGGSLTLNGGSIDYVGIEQGGNLYIPQGSTVGIGSFDIENRENVAIKGGKFKVNPNEYVDQTYYAVYNPNATDGYPYIVGGDYKTRAIVDGVIYKFKSFIDAFNFFANNQVNKATLIIESDYDVRNASELVVPENKDITIIGKDSKAKGETEKQKEYTLSFSRPIKVAGKLTLIDGKYTTAPDFRNTETFKFFYVVNKGSLVVKRGTIDANNISASARSRAAAADDANAITVENGGSLEIFSGLFCGTSDENSDCYGVYVTGNDAHVEISGGTFMGNTHTTSLGGAFAWGPTSLTAEDLLFPGSMMYRPDDNTKIITTEDKYIDGSVTVHNAILTGLKFNTMIAPENLSFRDTGVRAFTTMLSTDSEGKNIITLNEVYTVSKGTPVVIYSDNIGGYSIPVIDDEVSEATGNVLTGCWVDTQVASDNQNVIYLLSEVGGEAKFILNNNIPSTVARGRAYISLPYDTAKNGITFVTPDDLPGNLNPTTPDIPSGIYDVNTSDNDANIPAYNLAGQRIDSTTRQRGITIRNGRKVAVK